MDSESEQLVLDSVDKFLEAEVRPVAHKLDPIPIRLCTPAASKTTTKRSDLRSA